MNILAFGTSSKTASINQMLAVYAANLVVGANVSQLSIADYEMPLYSEDREQELGQPPAAHAFRARMAAADALVISFAEHNGSYTAAFKNLFDWASRIDRSVFQQKPVVYLSTSPGSGGGANMLGTALSAAPHFGANVIASLSVPSFYDNFSIENRAVVDAEVKQDLENVMQKLAEHLTEGDASTVANVG
ncbi:MAG: chromate reductase [Halieaceae bacterium]|jgi:chromate reductase